MTTLEKQMMEVGTENVYGSFGAQLALPAYIDGFGCFLAIDALFWFATVGGSEYAYTNLNSTDSLPIQGQLKENSFDWDFGYQVAIGYLFVDDGFDLALHYTWFDTVNSDASALDQPSALYMLKSPLLFTMGQSVKSDYRIGYNEMDLMLGRNYFVSARLCFHPKLGLQGVWIDQRQKVRYFDVVADPSYGVVEVRNIDRCRYWGLGPAVFSGTNWYIKHGISIYGDVGVSLLFGSFSVSQDHSMTSTGEPEEVEDVRINLTGQTKNSSPFFSLGLGLMWETYLEENCARIMLALGYEANYFWAQNKMLYSDLNDGTGTSPIIGIRFKYRAEDISFSGINLKLRVDF